MARPESLRRLAALHGVQMDYWDLSGQRHETTAETCEKLLAAMGVQTDGDLEALIAAEEEAPWRRPLPPVAVVRRNTGAGAVELVLPAEPPPGAWRWTLCLEDGGRREGRFDPERLETLATRRVDGTELVRLLFPLPLGDVPLGYHRLEMAPEGGETTAAMATMTLIVAPARCHLPEALQDDGRLWGLAVQLYGLRSRRNWGIGDFGDLSALAELAARAGAGFVGLNPLHAQFLADPSRFSPYSPNSRLCLNALYVDVDAVPDVAESEEARALLADPAFQARRQRLRAAELVDYEGVSDLKVPVLRLAFESFQRRHLARNTSRAGAWRRFREEGGEELESFALFEAVHAYWRAKDSSFWGWPAWPEEYRTPGSAELEDFARTHREEIDFAIYLQWLADGQLEAAADLARRRGMAVGFYRDLALGADSGGAEAWRGQEIYVRGAHIGAPPDDFSPKGQDWGLPPPAPRRLKEAAYAPFSASLRANMRHAGAIRVDHVMALARLFWVPAGGSPREGAYVGYPLEDLLGIVALESVRNRCLVIGEDLGTVPDKLRDTLAANGILSYRVLYFEKEWGGALQAPAAYPRQALATVSTHDLPTLAGFWQGRDIEEQGRLDLFPSPDKREAAVVARAQDRARLLIALQKEDLLPEGLGADPVTAPAVTPELSRAVHEWLARTPSMLLCVQAEDVLGAIEQANLPGAPADYPNWRRRLPLPLEDWPGDGRLSSLGAALRAGRGFPVPDAGTETGQPLSAAIPVATYRLQFNKDFPVAAATALVPYLSDLGISHCYASSYLKARPGSTHGYDIVDHNAYNPEIGTPEEFRAFSDALAREGMGQILDIVPNHMGVMGSDNAWWLDVLENGRASAFAAFFDIDWQPLNPQLAGKVLLPILGDHYGAVLERGELKLAFDREKGEFSVFYYQHRFPVDPAEYPRIVGIGIESLAPAMGDDLHLAEFLALLRSFGQLPSRQDPTPGDIEARHRDKEIHKAHLARLCGDCPALLGHVEAAVVAFNGLAGNGEGRELLHELIKAQAWRLAYWRVASDEINYRRFFEINDLAALRMEDPAVFEATHGLVLSLVAEGRLQGLRIDHSDGLFEPARYFRRLGEKAAEAGVPAPYLIIEKILADHERLPEDWPIHGETGYRFSNLANGLFVDGEAEEEMARIYEEFIGAPMDFDTILHDAKLLIIRRSLHAELNVLANRLWHIAAASRQTCDFTLYGLRDALADVASWFPVYRTYVAQETVSPQDRRHIDWAIGVARKLSRTADPSVFDFVRSVLTGDIAAGKGQEYRDQVWHFAMKFQQFTAPVTAKGMEDTAFYRYHRLASLNDVGGDPRRFGVSVAAFHAENQARAAGWPHCLLAGSTHDSKRSEDVRALIDVLSEVPAAWEAALERWSRINRSKKTEVDGRPAPSANDEYLLYQTLFGTWPLTDPDPAALADYAARISAYMLKAAREAKEQTSWVNGNAEYEAALQSFVEAALAPGEKNLFLADFAAFARSLAPYGLVNSLGQLLLRLTAPGVPDIYQGCELWQFRLVDPDNRRPVDYALCRRLLEEVKALREGPPETWAAGLGPLVENMEDGRIKLCLLVSVLEFRHQEQELFRDGGYLPLTVSGSRAAQVCAFARRQGEAAVITVVPRLLAKLRGVQPDNAAPPFPDWGDTRIELPEEWKGRGWLNVLTGQSLAPDGTALEAAALFKDFPVALLAIGGT